MDHDINMDGQDVGIPNSSMPGFSALVIVLEMPMDVQDVDGPTEKDVEIQGISKVPIEWVVSIIGK